MIFNYLNLKFTKKAVYELVGGLSVYVLIPTIPKMSITCNYVIHNARFDQPDASIMDINYTSGRKLNKELINRLATCEYISEHRNLFITGATGCGKTYMACAFGMEACKQYYNTRYVRLPDLLIDLEMARTDGTYRKVIAKYAIPLADAIIDRIAYDSYRVNITSIDAEHDISMREVYGLDKVLRE